MNSKGQRVRHHRLRREHRCRDLRPPGRARQPRSDPTGELLGRNPDNVCMRRCLCAPCEPRPVLASPTPASGRSLRKKLLGLPAFAGRWPAPSRAAEGSLRRTPLRHGLPRRARPNGRHKGAVIRAFGAEPSAGGGWRSPSLAPGACGGAAPAIRRPRWRASRWSRTPISAKR